MRRAIQAVIMLSMILLSTASFGQKTYLDLMVNVVSTNLNYGGTNNGVADYKKAGNGIQAGASFQAGITGGFSVVPEIYFIRKGGSLKANNPLTGGGSRLRLNSIELPMLARFHFGLFYLNAGPSIAYNISGDRKIEDVSSKLSFTNSTGGFKRFDAGIQMGGGAEFPFKRKRIAVDVRYSYGLTNIAHDSEIHNRALIVSVHFSRAWKKNPFTKQQAF